MSKKGYMVLNMCLIWRPIIRPYWNCCSSFEQHIHPPCLVVLHVCWFVSLHFCWSMCCSSHFFSCYSSILIYSPISISRGTSNVGLGCLLLSNGSSIVMVSICQGNTLILVCLLGIPMEYLLMEIIISWHPLPYY